VLRCRYLALTLFSLYGKHFTFSRIV